MTYTDEFDGPGSTAAIDWTDQKGRLLLVQAHSLETGIKTEFGETDAVRADIVILDAEGGPEELSDVLIFPKVLQGQVRKNIGTGRRNLGRLGQGEKKPGKSAPWLLQDPTDADKASARAYISKNAEPPF
jgi:hypothetical protein